MVTEDDISREPLRHGALLMLGHAMLIFREWRVWIVNDEVIAYSLYKEGSQVTYRREIDDDAFAFAWRMVEINPDHSQAYVIDICRTEGGLKLSETNRINAAGFYAADLWKLVVAIDTFERDANALTETEAFDGLHPSRSDH